MKVILSLVISSLVLWVVPAAAETMVHEAWARATAGPPRTGAIYLTLVNHGADDALIGAATAAADRTEIHTVLHEDGMMKMRPLARLALPAGATVALEPGGEHLMLFGLAAPLVAGESLDLELEFESGARRQVRVEVRPLGAAGPEAAHDMSHDHH